VTFVTTGNNTFLVDIILVETLKRLRNKLESLAGPSFYKQAGNAKGDDMIDETRILPRTCAEIVRLPLERDLPSFPAAPLAFSNHVGGVSFRHLTWPQPAPLDSMATELNDMEREFCSIASCRMWRCRAHSRFRFILLLNLSRL
jgi:hypothetical protein